MTFNFNSIGCSRQCLEKSNEIHQLGDGKVKININAIKQQILIRGNRDAVIECQCKVKSLLDKLVRTPLGSATDTENICPLCADNFNSPYLLQQCGHIFCHSCLHNYFDTRFDKTLSFKEFKLCCPANDCNQVCLIRDIQSILESDELARLATVAYQLYIRNGKDGLVQCVGNDCKQIIHIYLYYF